MTGPASPDGPVELVVRDTARGDLDQHLAEIGMGIGYLFEDEPADAGSLVGADGLHRQLPSDVSSSLSSDDAARTYVRKPRGPPRSEERRVGKECRSRGRPV